MGPRLVSRGKTKRRENTAENTAKLQWGRDLLVAERRTLAVQFNDTFDCFNGAATC